MIESPMPEEEIIIEKVRNLFRLDKLKKETIYTRINDIRNIFRLKKENKEIEDRIIINIRNLYKPGDIRNIF